MQYTYFFFHYEIYTMQNKYLPNKLTANNNNNDNNDNEEQQ